VPAILAPPRAQCQRHESLCLAAAVRVFDFNVAPACPEQVEGGLQPGICQRPSGVVVTLLHGCTLSSRAPFSGARDLLFGVGPLPLFCVSVHRTTLAGQIRAHKPPFAQLLIGQKPDAGLKRPFDLLRTKRRSVKEKKMQRRSLFDEQGI